MEVKKGYKQTEVGIIPNDWNVKRIGDIADIVSGGTPSTRIAEYWNGTVNWCTPTDITGAEGKFLTKTGRRISEEGLKNSSATLLPPGTLLLCTRATIGDVKIATTNIATNQGFKSLICKDEVDNEFVYYKVLTIKRKLIEKGIGSTFLEVSKKDTASIEIAIPKLKDEQHAIATALSDVDSLLTALDSLLAKKRLVKQGAMQELLTGKRRLSGFSSEWEEKKLEDIVEFVNGKPLESIVSSEGDYFLITLDSIDINGKLKPYHKRTSYFDNSLRKGDIVVILSDIAHGYLLGLCDLIPEDNKYLLNQRVGRLRCNDEYVPEFLRLQINRNQEFFRKRGQGTSQRHIYKRDIYELSISLPKKPEQQAIVEILSDMDAEINALESRREKTRQLKVGMMQELLTGRIRLL